MVINTEPIINKAVKGLGNGLFGTVPLNKAVSAVRQGVEETASAAKKEIEDAIKPFKDRIANKDEYISQLNQKNNELTTQNNTLSTKNSTLTQTNEDLQKEIYEKDHIISKQKTNNEHLTETLDSLNGENKELQSVIDAQKASITEQQQNYNKLNTLIQNARTEITGLKESVRNLDWYKTVYKEAYKQGITPEIKEQKSGIAGILSALIQHKTQISEQSKNAIETTSSKKTKPKKPIISKEIKNYIDNERKKQILDKTRMDKAVNLLKGMFEGVPEDDFRGVPQQFRKTRDRLLNDAYSRIDKSKRIFTKNDYGLIRQDFDKDNKLVMEARVSDELSKPHNYKIYNSDNTTTEIYDDDFGDGIKIEGNITFSDTSGKRLLNVIYDDCYYIYIFDKNNCLMVSSSIENGYMKTLSVKFNDIKPTADIKYDEPMNNYAKDIILNAKKNTVKNDDYLYNIYDQKRLNSTHYINSEGKKVVKEDYYERKPDSPSITRIYNPDSQNVKICIMETDSKEPQIKGIDNITKYNDKDKNSETFDISFYRDSDKSHWEVLTLYRPKQNDTEDSFKRMIYYKYNFGLATYPLTNAFSFCDLSPRKIVAWDFDKILKDYIK